MTWCRELSNSQLAVLQGLHSLVHLTLGDGQYQLTKTYWHYVGQLRSLTCLDLAQSRITDKGLEHLCNLSVLKCLNLHGCLNITKEGLRNVGNLITLKHLDLGLFGCVYPQFRRCGKNLDRLASLTNLMSLVLETSKISNGWLQSIGKLTTLTYLELASCLQ